MHQGYTAVAQRAYILLPETLPGPQSYSTLAKVFLDPQTTGHSCAHSERGRERNAFSFLEKCVSGISCWFGASLRRGCISFLNRQAGMLKLFHFNHVHPSLPQFCLDFTDVFAHVDLFTPRMISLFGK